MNNTPEEIKAAQGAHDKVKALVAIGDLDGAARALGESLTDAINKAMENEMEIDEMINSATKALMGYPVDTDVRDLLADLMHYADARGINFDEELVMARANHRREVMHDLG